MRRSRLLPATVVLATVSALTLLAAAVAIRPGPIPPNAATEAANRAAVRRFYEAVNDVIATGDAESLTYVLSPDYVETDDDGALVPGHAVLERAVLALHATVPNLRLEATDLVGDDERVLAVIRAGGETQATTFGLNLDDPLWWSPVVVFQIDAGLIAERTTIGRRPARLEPIVQAPLALPPTAQGVATVSRVTLEPGGWLREPGVPGARVLVVEAGTLEVGAAPHGRTTGRWDGAVAELEVGDWLVVPDGAQGSGYATRNDESGSAVYLDVLVTASAARSGAASSTSAGAEARIMAGGQLVALPGGSASLVVARVSLAPGVRLAWVAPAGPVLLWVEHGRLDLVTETEADAWVRDQTGAVQRLPRTLLATGEGALFDTGTDAEIRNVGDVTLEVVIVTLLVAAEEPATDDA